jgi:hypothetical protein
LGLVWKENFGWAINLFTLGQPHRPYGPKVWTMDFATKQRVLT